MSLSEAGNNRILPDRPSVFNPVYCRALGNTESSRGPAGNDLGCPRQVLSDVTQIETADHQAVHGWVRQHERNGGACGNPAGGKTLLHDDADAG